MRINDFDIASHVGTLFAEGIGRRLRRANNGDNTFARAVALHELTSEAIKEALPVESTGLGAKPQAQLVM